MLSKVVKNYRLQERLMENESHKLACSSAKKKFEKLLAAERLMENESHKLACSSAKITDFGKRLQERLMETESHKVAYSRAKKKPMILGSGGGR